MLVEVVNQPRDDPGIAAVPSRDGVSLPGSGLPVGQDRRAHPFPCRQGEQGLNDLVVEGFLRGYSVVS